MYNTPIFFEPVHKSNKFCNCALAMNTQTTRRKLTPEFKAKVVIEALREQSTLDYLPVPQRMITFAAPKEWTMVTLYTVVP